VTLTVIGRLEGDIVGKLRGRQNLALQNASLWEYSSSLKEICYSELISGVPYA
jgi:hypothetical protein